MNGILKYLEGDRNIWIIVLFLSVFSILAIYSSTGTLAFKYQDGNTEYYLFKQLFLIGAGIILMFGAHRIQHQYYSRIAQLMLYITVPLLLLTLLFGTDINDAKRWITVPFLNISFQTSDFAKLALIMYTARMLAKKQSIIDDFEKAVLPIILPVLGICFLIVPADLSTAVVLYLTCVLLMFIGRVSVKYIGISVLTGVFGFLLFWFIATSGLYESRVETWKARFGSFMDTSEVPYQVVQSKIAIAQGGTFGVGLGKSSQRNFLPQPYSDFIYSIILEEYGLIAGLFILMLYLWLLYRAIQVFVLSPGAFGAFLAVGLSLLLVTQALINMAVTVNLLPVTGLPLPMISMGGTSLLFTCVSLGMILSVSRGVEKQVKMG